MRHVSGYFKDSDLQWSIGTTPLSMEADPPAAMPFHIEALKILDEELRAERRLLITMVLKESPDYRIVIKKGRILLLDVPFYLLGQIQPLVAFLAYCLELTPPNSAAAQPSVYAWACWLNAIISCIGAQMGEPYSADCLPREAKN